jgi:hypothetical protein
MLHAEVDKNLWSEHSVEASLFPLSSCNQAWLRNSCATHGSCNRRSLAANRGEWGSYVTVCWDHPLRIVEKKPCQREDHLLLPTGVFFNETQTQILDDSKNPDCRKPQAGVLHIATQAKLSRLDLAVDRAPPNPIPPSSTGTLLQKCGNYLRQSLFFVFKGWGIIFQQVD